LIDPSSQIIFISQEQFDKLQAEQKERTEELSKIGWDDSSASQAGHDFTNVIND
jgi:hypothetical protein